MKILTQLVMIFFVSAVIAQSDYQEQIDRGRELLDDEKYEDSKEIFENILDHNDEIAEAHYYLASVYFRLGDLDESIDHAEEAIELDESNADFHYLLGQLYGRDAQQASIFRAPFVAGKVKDEFERTVELDPDHLGGRLGLAQFYIQAPGFLGGDIDKAFEHAKILIDVDEKNGRFLLFQIHESEERFSEAEDELKILEQKFGDDTDFYYFYNNYGYFLMNQNRIDEAIEKFKKQVALAPDRSNPHDSLGEALWKNGMLNEALAEYKKAVEINPVLESSLDAIEEIEEELE